MLLYSLGAIADRNVVEGNDVGVSCDAGVKGEFAFLVQVAACSRVMLAHAFDSVKRRVALGRCRISRFVDLSIGASTDEFE